MDKQYLLLVDDNDNFLGKYEEKEICHNGQGIHHRAFVVCLFNNNNEILLQKRKHKRWNNVWDVSAISHPLHFPDHDESYEEAALRSLMAEMGIENVTLEKISGFNYFAKYNNQCENEYCAVLTGYFDGEIYPNMDLVYEYKWINTQEFINDCRDNPNLYAPWTILTAGVIDN